LVRCPAKTNTTLTLQAQPHNVYCPNGSDFLQPSHKPPPTPTENPGTSHTEQNNEEIGHGCRGMLGVVIVDGYVNVLIIGRRDSLPVFGQELLCQDKSTLVVKNCRWF